MEVKIIGRDSKCNIVINDQHVSRKHLQIMKDDNGNYSIFDLESTTGTYVNGKKIKGEVKLQNHDIVKIGNTLLKWKTFFDINQTINKTEKKENPKNIIKINNNEKIEEKNNTYKNESSEIANFWLRLAALLIDFVFLIVILILINYVLMYYVTYQFTFNETIITHHIVSHIIAWLYFASFESTNKQATFGKQIIKIKVVALDNNSKISFINATGRHFAKYISTLTIFIGWLMPFWNKKHQTLHDILSKTIIIRI